MNRTEFRMDARQQREAEDRWAVGDGEWPEDRPRLPAVCVFTQALMIILVGLIVGCVLQAVAHSAPPSPSEIAAYVAMVHAQKHSAPALVVQHVGKSAESGQPETPQPAVRPSIKWVTPEEARKSPKPNWWHVTSPDIQSCPACLKCEAAFSDPRMIAWSEEFDCIRTTVGDRYPADVITSNDEKYKYRWGGYPGSVLLYTSRLMKGKALVTPSDK